MIFLRVISRVFIFLILQTVFITLAALLCLILPFWQKMRWRLAAYWGRIWAGLCCRALNIKIRHQGISVPPEPMLVVSNHIGMPDIFVMGSLKPGFFVAKLDVQGWPLIGWMAGVGGAIFVDRQRRQTTGNLVDQMVLRLKAGRSVHLFPEGGAMEVAGISPFKTPPFEAAIRAGVPVLPIVLQYHDDQQPSVACWHSISFFQHLINVLKYPQLEVTATVLPPVSGFEKRRKLAEAVREEMRGCAS